MFMYTTTYDYLHRLDLIDAHGDLLAQRVPFTENDNITAVICNAPEEQCHQLCIRGEQGW